MSEDNYIIVDLDDVTVLPNGKKLRDCNGDEVVANAIALLKYVFGAATGAPGLSEHQRRAVSRDLITQFVAAVRCFADTGEGGPIQ